MKQIAIALSMALVLFANACGGSSDPVAERSRLGDKKERTSERSDKEDRPKKKENTGAKDGVPEGVPDGGSVLVDGKGTLPEEIDVPGADEEKTYPTASSDLNEPDPDGRSQGLTESYAELLAVSVKGLGKHVRITMLFNGEVPQQMPNDKTIMVIGFQMLRGKEGSFAFAGQATDKGWQPYAGGKSKQTDFPGEFDVSGDTITMEIPWSYVGGAHPFKWLATSNWFRSLANTTHYLFDLAPNKGQANYPG
jgi:hypothetical protein